MTDQTGAAGDGAPIAPDAEGGYTSRHAAAGDDTPPDGIPASSDAPGDGQAGDAAGGAAAGAAGDAGAGAAGGAAAGTPARPVRPKKRARKFWRELLTILAAAIALTMLIKIFVLQVYEIPSASMQNTLMPGDRVLVNKLVYHFRHIARGDIVVFNGAGSWGNLEGEQTPVPSNPVVRVFDDALTLVGLRNDSTYYIKRVIGVPGDHVACCTGGLVTINGVPLHEQAYLPPGVDPSKDSFKATVPAGELWVMGDNRIDSLDSRYQQHATIPESAVVGRAFWIIWPPSRFGDLPIPNAFSHLPAPASTAAEAALLAAPILLIRHRRRQRP
jgi:signal peptidase I